MSLVLDTSATLACFYPDEITASTRTLLEKVKSEGAWVPLLWHLEVANVLLMAVRRGRHTASLRNAILADLTQLPIRTDLETNTHAWSTTERLAEKHRLTMYDAAYLEVALRRGLPLATLDRELRLAAEAEGLSLLLFPSDTLQ